MSNSNNRKLYWYIFPFAFLLFFLIKYGGSHSVQYFYQKGYVNALNMITGGEGAQSLDFYVGRADDVLFGPLSSVLSGLLLLFFCFIYQHRLNAFKFGLAVFVYLLITRFEVLFYPPWGDTITGIFYDVMWIVRHSFDYRGLFRQTTLGMGGPLCYPISFYPSFLAFLISITPSPEIFLITIHLIVFVFGSIIVSVFREILSDIFDEKIALSGAILLLSLPLFQSMVEMINMAIPNLFFAILCIYFLIKKEIVPASAMGVFALLVKAPGGIICAVVFLGSVMLFFIRPQQKARVKILLWGIATGAFAVIMFAVRSHIMGKNFATKSMDITNNIVDIFIGWSTIRVMPMFWIFLLSVLFLIMGFILWWRKGDNKNKGFSDFCVEHFNILIMFVIVSLWFFLYINFMVMCERYKLLVAPFLIICVMYAFLSFVKNEKVVKWVLMSAITFSLISSHGLLYSHHSYASDYCVGFEGSLEYRNSIKGYMRLAKEIEENYSNQTIVAPLVLAQVLDFREIGYVKKPLEVMMFGIKSQQESIKNFRGLRYMNRAKTVWVVFPDHGLIEGIEYPIDSKYDKVLKLIESGDKKISIFKGGIAIERMRLIVNRSLQARLSKNKGVENN